MAKKSKCKHVYKLDRICIKCGESMYDSLLNEKLFSHPTKQLLNLVDYENNHPIENTFNINN